MRKVVRIKDEKATLSGFLEEVALVADIDSLDEDKEHVVLMTLHSAKGDLNFHVFILRGWKMDFSRDI